MRPIERRLEVVEKRIRPANLRHRIFIVPRDGDEEAFMAECRREAGQAPCRFIRFVAPGEVPKAA